MAMFNTLSNDGKFQSYHIHGSGHCLVGANHTIHSFYMGTTIDCDIYLGAIWYIKHTCISWLSIAMTWSKA